MIDIPTARDILRFDDARFPVELAPELAGSDPSSMVTSARLDGGEWVLNGAKRWIGLAAFR